MNKIKKVISIILISFIMVSMMQNSEAFAEEIVVKSNIEIKATDVTPPEIDINSISINKQEVSPGEEVKVSFKAKDSQSEIRSAYVYYKTPIRNMSKYISLKYNSNTDTFEGTMTIGELEEEGLWKVYYIEANDTAGNSAKIYDLRYEYGSGIKQDLSKLDFNVKGTNPDVTPPEIDISSISINKQEVSPGEEVKVSFKAKDSQSEIRSAYVYYKTPIRNMSKYISLKYNSNTDTFEGTITIGELEEEGLWKVYYIEANDTAGNSAKIYDLRYEYGSGIKQDLSRLDFNVKGTNSDVTPPVIDINSISINKQEVSPGEEVKVSFKAKDSQSEIRSAYVYYKTPIRNMSKYISLKYNSNTDTFEGTMTIGELEEEGLWKVYYIEANDTAGNSAKIYDLRYEYGSGIKQDLSKLDFIVQADNNTTKPIDGIEVITKNEYLSNKTINGDLYIGPEAILTVSGSVTVTGNVYVLGALKTYGGLTINGTLYGRNMTWGSSSTLYNGSIVMSGSNYVSSINISNYPVQDIPIRVDSAILLPNGSVDIKGATINVADMYVEGNKIDLDYKGRFELKNINIDNKNKVNIEFVTVFGNKITKEIAVFEKEDVNKDGKVDIVDLAKVAKEYNKNNYSDNWTAEFDFNKDNIIDLFDLVFISKRIDIL